VTDDGVISAAIVVAIAICLFAAFDYFRELGKSPAKQFAKLQSPKR
jgi:hypothetical protein